jgi:hypothetical protein
MGHKQTRVKYRGQMIDVDAGIKDFLQELWALGIETAASCEDIGGGVAWVQTVGPANLDKLPQSCWVEYHGPASMYLSRSQHIYKRGTAP